MDSSSPYLPPPLVWFGTYVRSVGRALGQNPTFSAKPSVNPLIYTVKVAWEEPLSGKLVNSVWNLLQQWAVLNDCVPEGAVSETPTSITVRMIVKRRLGAPKDVTPWG
jgi:hypothetical protein